MVHEIATGKRSWEDARRIERLLFEVPESGTEDLDESVLRGLLSHGKSSLPDERSDRMLSFGNVLAPEPYKDRFDDYCGNTTWPL
jgi:hypothetical protein